MKLLETVRGFIAYQYRWVRYWRRVGSLCIGCSSPAHSSLCSEAPTSLGRQTRNCTGASQSSQVGLASVNRGFGSIVLRGFGFEECNPVRRACFCGSRRVGFRVKGSGIGDWDLTPVALQSGMPLSISGLKSRDFRVLK